MKCSSLRNAILLVMGLSIALAGCSTTPAVGGGQVIPRPTDRLLEAYDSALVLSTNEFGLNLFRALHETENNVFISPVSIATALAMAYNGARGETRAAMAAVLGNTGVELGRFNENNLSLLCLLQEPLRTLNYRSPILFGCVEVCSYQLNSSGAMRTTMQLR